MALWRDSAFVEDSWERVADEAPIPADRAVLISLARWRRNRDSLAGREGEVAVEIFAGKDALEHIDDAADRPLVALRFDKFVDGRAFSYAILLRERCGFKGELRASGDVLLDEIPLMLRCGFTSFEVVDGPTLRALAEGRLRRFARAFQPSFDKSEPSGGARPWLRRVA